MLAGTLNKRHLSDVPKEFSFYLFLGVVIYLFSNLFTSQFISIISFIIFFGLIQGILDVYLKNSLRDEGQIKVLYFQILVSLSSLIIVFISYKLQDFLKNIPIVFLLITPFLILKILKMNHLDASKKTNIILYKGFDGALMKLLPTITYSVVLITSSLFVESDVLVARIGFFIFGFAHLYIMSSKLQVLSIFRIWQFILIFITSSLILLIPLILIRHGDIIAGISKNSPYILLCSLIFTSSLVLYSYMLNKLKGC